METVKPQLYLNMIIKQDEPVEMVQRSLDSVKEHVDGMYITVTYSDTYDEESPLVHLLREYGATLSFFKWIDDFAAARQYALDQVPRGENKYVYWQDADDILDGAENLQKALDTAVKLQWAGVFFVYYYRVELDEKGDIHEVVIKQERERIIRNDGTYKWVGMLHETLIGVRQENLQQRLWKECTVIHLSTEERTDESLRRNIRILEKQLAHEQHRDPRTLVYLAKAYYDQGMEAFKQAKIAPENDTEEAAVKREEEAKKIREEWFDKALLLFDEYLNGSGELGSKDYIEQSGWEQERATAWQFVAQIFQLKNDLDRAIDAINQAIEEAPDFPQYYIDKALYCAQKKDFKRAKHWLTVGTNIEIPDTTLMLSPRDMKMRALECDAHIAMAEQDLKRVIQDYEKLLVVDPDNETFKQNLMVAASLEAANKAGQSIVYIGKYLEKIGEKDKIAALLNAVPNDLQKEPFYSQMRHIYIPPQMWEENEIAIMCGPGFEDWTPNSIDKGIGGSEEAVIYLSQELTKLGWKVTVFAQPGDGEGDYDGVTYYNYYKFNPDDLFNHLIVWRAIGFADIKPKVRGKMLLWLHDMPNLPDFTPQRLSRFDKIAVLSQFHREQIKQYDNEKISEIPDDRFFLTRNGIPDLGITTWKGNPHRICYVSSPDRGLIYLLKHWKEVREAVPDAELHIYYGFEVYDYIHRNNPAKMAFKKKIMEMMDQEGIVYHARVSHKELAKEMNQCGIWAYPTDFTEISCISAMKAQATGAVPVVTDFAALKETVKDGVRVDVDIQEKSGQKIYFDTLIDMLKHPKKQAELRNIQFAQEYFSWKNVAIQWDGYFKDTPIAQQQTLTPQEWQKKLLGKNK